MKSLWNWYYILRRICCIFRYKRKERGKMKIQITELTGVRATLLPLSLEHKEGLFQASKSPDIWTYLPAKINSIEDTKKFIRNALVLKEQGTEFPFVVFDQASQQIVGSTRFLNISLSNR